MRGGACRDALRCLVLRDDRAGLRGNLTTPACCVAGPSAAVSTRWLQDRICLDRPVDSGCVVTSVGMSADSSRSIGSDLRIRQSVRVRTPPPEAPASVLGCRAVG